MMTRQYTGKLATCKGLEKVYKMAQTKKICSDRGAMLTGMSLRILFSFDMNSQICNSPCENHIITTQLRTNFH